MDALMKIQQELKAPKNQFNNFGKYKYRSCEDILEAVKPLLAKYGAQLTLSDDIVQIGDRIYVKATASITDGLVFTEVTAYAREPIDKKGMDDSQITGTASSYARKYALNGLFLIDDTKDADTDEHANQTKNSAYSKTVSQATVKVIEQLIKETNTDKAKMLEYYQVGEINELTTEQAKNCVANLKKKQNG